MLDLIFFGLAWFMILIMLIIFAPLAALFYTLASMVAFLFWMGGKINDVH